MKNHGSLTFFLAAFVSMFVTIVTALPHETTSTTSTTKSKSTTTTTTHRRAYGDDNIIIKRDHPPTTKQADADDNVVDIEKRQYAYVTITAPTTLTYTSTAYSTVTSQPIYTQYATMTVTAGGGAAGPLAADNVLAGSRPTITVTVTVTPVVTKTVYIGARSMPARFAMADANDAAVAAATVTQTITQQSTITQPAAVEPVKTIALTTLITPPPPNKETITQTTTATVYQTSITGTTTIPVTLAAAGKMAVLPVPFPRDTAPEVMKRGEPVTVTDTLTPSTTLLVTSTITVPGVWIMSTIYTATTTIPAPNPAQAPAHTLTTTIPATATSTTSIVIGTTSQPPAAAPAAASTVFVTVTDFHTVTAPPPATGGGTVTDWVTSTVPAPPGTGTTTAMVTVTTTKVAEVAYSEFVVPTKAQ